jgi:vacuolar-type H+-ATPase subunit F/Vma7
MKTIVVGDRDSVLLFALEGVEGKIVEDSESAVDELKRIKKSKAYGLLIVTEEVEEWASDFISHLRFSKDLPLVVDIPGGAGHVQKGKSLADYIREAVGIRI